LRRGVRCISQERRPPPDVQYLRNDVGKFRFAHEKTEAERNAPMTNTPRDPKQNQNPNDKADKANMDDPNHDRNNDGQRRQQEAEQGRQGQQGQTDQNPQQKRPDDQRKDQGKPQQR